MTDDSHLVFDRRLVRRHRDRAAGGLEAHDFLFRHSAAALAERLEDVTRDFSSGARSRLPWRRDGARPAATVRTSGSLVQCDLSPAMARRAGASGHPALAADEEFLPFRRGRVRPGGQQSQPALGQRPARRADPDPPRAEAGRAVPGRDAGRRHPGRTARRADGRGNRDCRRRQSAPIRPSPICAMPPGCFSAPASPCQSWRVGAGHGEPTGNAFQLFADLRGMGETNATPSPATPHRRRAHSGRRPHGRYGESHRRCRRSASPRPSGSSTCWAGRPMRASPETAQRTRQRRRPAAAGLGCAGFTEEMRDRGIRRRQAGVARPGSGDWSSFFLAIRRRHCARGVSAGASSSHPRRGRDGAFEHLSSRQLRRQLSRPQAAPDRPGRGMPMARIWSRVWRMRR